MRTARTPCLVAVLSLALAATGAAPVRVLPTTGRIAGHVRDGRGVPILHAQIQVVGTAFSALTDTAGAYEIAAVPVGTVTVRAARAGYAPAESGGTVRAGGTLTLNFTLGATGKEEPLSRVADERRGATTSSVETPRATPGSVEMKKSADRAARQDALGFGLVNAAAMPSASGGAEDFNTEAYNVVNENRFLGAASNPLSTF